MAQFKKQIIAVLGGSFDPPTIAHFEICKKVIENKLADKVWVIPSGIRKDKINKTQPIFRLQMTQIAQKEFQNEDILVNDIEFQQEGSITIPTYHLMNKLRDIYQNNQFKFIVGSDLLKDLLKWNNGEKLVIENDFIVIKRKGFDIQEQFLPQKSEILNIDSDISSTEVRNLIQTLQLEKLKEKKLIFEGVFDFIIKNDLYKEK